MSTDTVNIDSAGETVKKSGLTGWKTGIGLFIISLFVNSNITVDHILSKIKNATNGRTTTAFGSLLQAGLLVLLFAMFLRAQRTGIL
jgi:hypothetical protein